MTTSTVGLLVAVLIADGTRAAQSPGDSESLNLLRQTIADQKRNPGKVIRTYTNLPPAEVKSAAPASEAAPLAVAQSKPAPESKPAPPPGVLPADKKAAAADLERQFLNGKLSARQYQKSLAELDNPSKPAAGQAAAKSKPAPKTTADSPRPSSGQGVVAPATPASPPQPTASHKQVSEVEARIDEMIRQKEARERAAKTNSPPAPGVKLSKRERLDFLLRQVVEGKLSDEQYKKEREKILAEPE